jgi:hypothetical protein
MMRSPSQWPPSVLPSTGFVSLETVGSCGRNTVPQESQEPHAAPDRTGGGRRVVRSVRVVGKPIVTKQLEIHCPFEPIAERLIDLSKSSNIMTSSS